MGDPEALRQMERACVSALEPAPSDHLENLLAELHSFTVSKSHDEFELNLLIRAYITRLLKYPADVAQNGVQGWDGKFFPSWGELKERLDLAVAPRNRMLNALREGLRRPPVARIEEKITEEQRIQLKADVERFRRLALAGTNVSPARSLAPEKKGAS